MKFVFTHKVGDLITGERSKHIYKIIKDLEEETGVETMVLESTVNKNCILAAKIKSSNTLLFLI